MRSRIHLLRIVLACLLFTGMVYAQGVGSSGDIKGTVTDPSGAVVGNATVTATDVANGIKHTVSTDSNGQFRVTGLKPAAYSVSVSKPASSRNGKECSGKHRPDQHGRFPHEGFPGF